MYCTNLIFSFGVDVDTYHVDHKTKYRVLAREHFTSSVHKRATRQSGSGLDWNIIAKRPRLFLSITVLNRMHMHLYSPYLVLFPHGRIRTPSNDEPEAHVRT